MVYQNLNHYLIFIVFSQLFFLVINGQFIPGSRVGHEGVLVGKRIYFIGGYNTNKGLDPTSDFFYFDFGVGTGSIVDLRSQGVNLPLTTLVGAPPSRFGYTATFVNGVIYYLGGMRQDGNNQLYALFSNIYRYDITTNTWSFKVGTGVVPPTRINHSAVSVDDKICIYGGTHWTSSALQQISILDTTTLIWSTPQLENINTPKLDDNNIPKLVHHSATLLDKFMFVAFGNSTEIYPHTANENYYIFDLGQPKIQWFKFIPDGNIPKTPNSNVTIPPLATSTNIKTIPTTKPTATSSIGNTDQQQSSNNMLTIGLSTGLGVIGLGTVIAFLFLYRRMKKNEITAAGGGEIGHSGGPDTSGVVLQISSNVDKNYPTMNQFESTPQYENSYSQQNYSNPTLIQPQGYYNPGQEFSTLSPREGFAKHSSNYFPGCENFSAVTSKSDDFSALTLKSDGEFGGFFGLKVDRSLALELITNAKFFFFFRLQLSPRNQMSSWL
ncbi:hypothetical protein C1645_805914 [Glomus cerebriforme]|uniref:Galactose oxidase n=1 Tax=Glomus cerebriforme TaxID=658196 RepID=A0A397SYK7_9GLOM|nr:hypothetical protein C1645_805914 [Glomus cerebriforme]